MKRKTVRSVLGVVLLVGFALAAWLFVGQAEPDWASADEFTLYSVDGRDPHPNQVAKPQTGETLHGYPVLGKVAVDDPADRSRLQAAFREATANPGKRHWCFWPRHVVRLRRGTDIVDYVICFQCESFVRHAGVELKPRGGGYIAINGRPAFDAPLTAAGVPIAPD